MPRKPTQPPKPIAVIKSKDLEIELLDTDRVHIGKGSHKKNDYEDKKWKLVFMVVDDYLNEHGLKKVTKNSSFNDYLKCATAFATEALSRGFGTANTEDDSALRKRYYFDVVKEFRIWIEAIKNKQN